MLYKLRKRANENQPPELPTKLETIFAVQEATQEQTSEESAEDFTPQNQRRLNNLLNDYKKRVNPKSPITDYKRRIVTLDDKYVQCKPYIQKKEILSKQYVLKSRNYKN